MYPDYDFGRPLVVSPYQTLADVRYDRMVIRANLISQDYMCYDKS
jgi:hypothetical protein